MFHEPNAVTDGDSIVHFRRADVIVTGDIFNTTQYPFIDVKERRQRAGRDQRAERHPQSHRSISTKEQGGTMVVPGHGYLSDEHEVVEYRDMVVIVRDRVQAMIKNGATLEQVKAARSHRRLRHPLRRKHRSVDHGHVRRGGLHSLKQTAK